MGSSSGRWTDFSLVHPSGLIIEFAESANVPLDDVDLPRAWTELTEVAEDDLFQSWWRKVFSWLCANDVSLVCVEAWSDAAASLERRGFTRKGRFEWERHVDVEFGAAELLYVGFDEIRFQTVDKGTLALVKETWDGFLVRTRGNPPVLRTGEYLEKVLNN